MRLFVVRRQVRVAVVLLFGLLALGALNELAVLPTTAGAVAPSIVVQPPAPVVTPGTGSYTDEVLVTISGSGTIFYRLDGNEPSGYGDGTRYKDPFLISTTTELKAKAFVNINNGGEVTIETYTVAPVATPTFTPVGATYATPQNVTLAVPTPAGATIRYTTDGTAPTVTSPIYSGPIAVTATTTIKARAFKGQMTPSAVATATYTFLEGTLSAPTIAPTSGTYPGSVTVTLGSSQTGATIRYTTNGDDPTAASALYTAPFTLTTTAAVKARAFHPNWFDSPVATAAYTIGVATPVFTPSPGTFTQAQTVSIATATPGATIRFTVDGTTPTPSSSAFVAPIPINTRTTIKAAAFKAGWANSPIASATYLFNYGTLAIPTIAPVAGTYTSSVTATASGPAGATLRYTTDGSEPSETSTVYVGPVRLIATATFRVRAFRTDWTPSATASTLYTVISNPPTAGSDTATTAEDIPIAIDVLTNDADPDGDTLSVASVSPGTLGSVRIGPGRFVTYTPLPNTHGTDTFTYVVTDGFGHNVQGTVTATITPVEDAPIVTLSATPLTGAPPLAVEFLANAFDPDSSGLTYTWTFGDGQTASGGVVQTHTYSLAGIYTASVTVQEGPGRPAVSRAVVITVAAAGSGETPVPDPTSVAPAVPSTTVTSFSAATAFLYTNANPVQRGVAAGTIDPTRVAVLRGAVFDEAGSPLAGARVTIAGVPAYGHTLTRADGMFDIAVNGGGRVVVQIDKTGYLSTQRPVTAPWLDYAWVDQARLVPIDPVVTTLQFAASPTAQVAQGSTVSDGHGARRATIIVPEGGVHANLHLPNGQVLVDQAQLNVRATEYTVGSQGPRMMPGVLPAASGYTYAVELSADEASAAGATMVSFDPALAFYVENFLNFPVGTIVPSGYYDREKGAWIAGKNGRVIRVLGTDGNGRAELDLTGAGVAADAPALVAQGITPGERTQLAARYASGQALWRIPIEHFTPWDFNWPFGPPADAEDPDVDEPDSDDEDETDTPCEAGGSIIECETRVLGEVLPVVGTALTLNYRSGRVPDHAAAVDVSVSKTGLPASVTKIEAEIEIAGQRIQRTLAATPNLRTTFAWDGRDAYGRKVFGPQKAKIRIRHFYPSIYYAARADLERSFGAPGERSIPVGNGRDELAYERRFDTTITANHPQTGFGGWTLEQHHTYSPETDVTYLGDGGRLTGSMGEYSVKQPLAASGKILAASPAGILAATAGGYVRIPRTGEPIPVSFPALADVSGLCGDTTRRGGHAVGPDGSLYYALRNDHAGFEYWADRVCLGRIRPDGTTDSIVTVPFPQAGNTPGPAEVAVAADGTVYLASRFWVFRRGPGETEFRVIFGAVGEFPVTAIAVGPTGELFVGTADTEGTGVGSGRIYKITSSGETIHVAGVNQTSGGPTPDEGVPASTIVVRPIDLAVASDGSIVFIDSSLISSTSRVRRISPDGRIATIAGGTTSGAPLEDGMSARQGRFRSTIDSALVLAADGSIYAEADDWGTPRLFHLSLVSRASAAGTSFLVPSPDASEVYEFDRTGRHLRTRDALDGVAIHSFDYDTDGRLIGVRDRDDLLTTIERDPQGNPQAIRGPFGQRTTLSFDANGWLSVVTDPASRATQMGYTAGGLLTSFTSPNGGTPTTFTYDAAGRLETDTDAVGGVQTLARTAAAGGASVSISRNAGDGNAFHTERLPNGDTRRIITAADGTQSVMILRADGDVEKVDAHGMRSLSRTGAEPRFGQRSALVTASTVSTPGGLSLQVASARAVTLADPQDIFSVQTETTTSTVNGRVTSTVYDAATRSVTTTSPEGRQTVTTFDLRGRPIHARRGSLLPIQYGYHPTSGLLTSLSQGERSTTYSYGTHGYLTGMTTAVDETESETHTFEHDLVGRLNSQTLSGNRPVTMGYDDDGNLTSVQIGSRPAYAFGYTPVGLQESAGTTGETPETATFRLDRKIETMTRPGGDVLQFGYEAGSGRLQSVTAGSESVSWGYNSTTGQVESVTGPDATVHFGYDGALKKEEQWSGGVNGRVNVAYGNDFRPTQQTINGAHPITFGYDNDGLLTSAGALTLTRHPQLGDITDTAVGNITESRTLDSSYGYISSREFKTMGIPFYASSYTYDRLGRLKTKAEILGGPPMISETYAYDAAGRLFEVSSDGQLVGRYTYDTNGNRLTTTTASGTITASYDSSDRLQTYGPISFTYKPSGVRHTKVEPSVGTTTYQYDGFGSLRSVSLPGGTTIAYAVDGQGRRIGRSVNGVRTHAWIYDGKIRPIAELDESGNVATRFVYGVGLNVPTYMVRTENGSQVTYRIVSDLSGSVRAVVNAATGVPAQVIHYDPWGQVLGDTNPGFQPFGFGGGLYDSATGLVRFGARDYDPMVGRWTAPDPVHLDGGDANLYAYVGNDPINRTDPTGLDWIDNSLAVAANFSAGFGDHLSFGLTDLVRDWLGFNEGIDKCGDAYWWGSASGVASDALSTGASLYLKHAAKKVSEGALKQIRARARKRLSPVNSGYQVHHKLPLQGHPPIPGLPGGNRPTMFPSAGLPEWLRNSRSNLEALGRDAHLAAHRRTIYGEKAAGAMGLANQSAALGRTMLTSCRGACN